MATKALKITHKNMQNDDDNVDENALLKYKTLDDKCTEVLVKIKHKRSVKNKKQE